MEIEKQHKKLLNRVIKNEKGHKLLMSEVRAISLQMSWVLTDNKTKERRNHLVIISMNAETWKASNTHL